MNDKIKIACNELFKKVEKVRKNKDDFLNEFYFETGINDKGFILYVKKKKFSYSEVYYLGIDRRIDIPLYGLCESAEGLYSGVVGLIERIKKAIN